MGGGKPARRMSEPADLWACQQAPPGAPALEAYPEEPLHFSTLPSTHLPEAWASQAHGSPSLLPPSGTGALAPLLENSHWGSPSNLRQSSLDSSSAGSGSSSPLPLGFPTPGSGGVPLQQQQQQGQQHQQKVGASPTLPKSRPAFPRFQSLG